MAALLRWLWVGLWRLQRGRALTAVAAVAIGVSLGLAIHLVHASALDEFGRAIAVVNGDAQAQFAATADRFDESLYAQVADDPRVESASPVLDVEVPLATPAGAALAPPRTVRIIGLDVFAAARVTPSLLPTLRDADDGTALFADDAVFLSPAALRSLGRAVGDTLALRVGLDTVPLRIAGEVRGAAADQSIGVMDIGALQWRLGRVGSLSRIDLRLVPGADLEALARDLDGKAGGTAHLLTPDRSAQRMSNLSRAYRVNLNVLSLVALFTGGFIVYSTLALAIARQRPALAILGVLGAPPRLPAVFVIGQGLILGTAGALLGVVAGIALAAVMLAVSGGDLGGGYFRGDTPALALEWGGIALYAAGGLLAGVAGALQPAWAARRLSPARALKGSEPASGRTRRLAWPLAFVAAGVALLALPPVDGLPVPAYLAIACWLLGGIAAVPAIVALAGRALDPLEGLLARWLPLWLAARRLGGAGGSASGALAGVVASFALASAMAVMVGSFRQSVDQWLGVVLPADLYARAGSRGDAGSLDPSLQARLAGVPALARVEFLRVREFTLDPARPPVTLLARVIERDDPGARLPLTGTAIDLPAGTVPVYVSEAMVDVYGWSPGRTVEVPLGPARAPLRGVVAAVWRDYARQHGAVAVDTAAYRAASGDDSVSDISAWLSPGVTADVALAAIRGAVPELADLDWRSAGEIRALSLRIFDRSFAVTYALEAIALVVGLFGVTATFAGEALSRAREFGMLRHLGATRAQIGAQLAAESLLLVTVGTAWGLLVGLAIAWVLVDRVNPQSFHWTMSFAWPVDVLATSAATLVMVGTLAATLAGRQAMGAAPVRAVREDW